MVAIIGRLWDEWNPNATTAIVVSVPTQRPILVDPALAPKAHGYARFIGESFMYSRDNTGIGLRTA